MQDEGEVDQSLDAFRSQWTKELKERKTQKDENDEENSSESLAAKFFMSAVELERKLGVGMIRVVKGLCQVS